MRRVLERDRQREKKGHMGQIVRRKKKGRPSKADLARRSGDLPAPNTMERGVRRSLRRRNVKYTIDYDDYLDEDSEDDEEEEMRREKKLKLMAKLNQDRERVERDSHGQESGSEEDETETERKPLKKRPINGADGVDKDEDDDDYEENDDDDDCEVCINRA